MTTGTSEKWNMFSVQVILNNGNKTTFISSMIGKDKKEAKKQASAAKWESGIKSLGSVIFKP